jgi:hypothetical protein
LLYGDVSDEAMSGNTLPYIMYAVVILLAIAITVFACVRWIIVKANWKRVEARIVATRLVVDHEGGKHLNVDVEYIFDDMMYSGSMASFDDENDKEGRAVAVLVNPQMPDHFNRDRNFGFQKTRIAKWLESKLAAPNRNS